MRVRIAETAHQMALLPFLWLLWLRARGERRDVAWWWLAGAFFVSWLADTAAHVVDPWLVSVVYPVSQATLVAAVLCDRKVAAGFVLLLVLTAAAVVLWRGVASPDVLVHTVAWAGVAAVAYDCPPLGRLRTALLIAFGWMWAAWMLYVIAPGWPTWLLFQSVRLAGLVAFCWAATTPTPRLRLRGA
jgi:hypothetical protein